MFPKCIKISLFVLLITVCLLFTGCSGAQKNAARFLEKAEALSGSVFTEEIQWELGNSPVPGVGHVVFFSVSDTTERAFVCSGTGETLAEAWQAAAETTREAILDRDSEPVWVKADVVYLAEEITLEQLGDAVKGARSEFFRNGVSLDGQFTQAFLEAELNGAKILEYENGGIDLSYLNLYLEKAGRDRMESLPETVHVFRTFGWFCDEKGEVLALAADTYDTGRRKLDFVDKDLAARLILDSSDFLLRQVKEDGSFVYGYYPRFDNEIENYNIVRHASTLWSLLCRYRMEPGVKLAAAIDKTIGYMKTQIRYSDENTAYLYEEKDDEIKLGGCGVAVIALTEYMDVFGTDSYKNLCQQLGNGILTMFDETDGSWVHVLNGEYTQKEAFRTVYYDGEATFALARLYGLTGDKRWLEAACTSVDRFIREDYTVHKDHWVAYTMNEITRYVVDRPDYYIFALQNAQLNLDTIHDRDTTYHTYLELLMATFEIYDRLVSSGTNVEGFDADAFIDTIYTRSVQMLNGFFFPEYAMYMENPSRILGTFMVRHDGYRVRIDDVQHNIGGYYLYYKNYEKLLAYGLAAYAEEGET